MLPNYITKDDKNPRHDVYEHTTKLYNGRIVEVFDKDSVEYKDQAYQYLCYDIIKQAIDAKVDLIWHEKPKITFKNETTQQDFDILRQETNFDEVLRIATRNYFLQGDSVLKVGIDSNAETSVVDDKKVVIFNINPSNWLPKYNQFNPNKFPEEQTFKIEKEIEENGGETEVYLFETHKAGQIIWTAWKEENDEYIQVRVLDYWQEELQEVIANTTKSSDMEIVYDTELLYPLMFFIQNNKDFESFFGKSDITLPVLSKLWALGEYANLAHKVIVNNTLPPLVLSEKMGRTLENIIDGYNKAGYQNDISLLDLDLTAEPKTTYSSYTALTTRIYKDMVKKLEVFVDDSRAGEGTHYLRNDYDLEQLRKQHEIFFRSIMTELGISEVLYNPILSTGAKSGVAYKRLMTLTLNETENTKRTLENLIKKLSYTLLQLAQKNNLIGSEPEYPSVEFYDGIITDEAELLTNIVTKVQNKLLPLKEAIMQANGVDVDTASQMLLDNNQSNSVKQNQPTVQSPSTVE